MAAQRATYVADQRGPGVQQNGQGNTAIVNNFNESSVDRLIEIRKMLKTTDPSVDKQRIESDKGGLMKDCYEWVLSDVIFHRWLSDPKGKLLWIHGELGQGKTMLMCGIIDHIESQLDSRSTALAYFFCQASDGRLQNKKAVLRGLNYMLLKHPSATKVQDEIVKKHADSQPDVFISSSDNAWFELKNILDTLVQPSTVLRSIIIIDGLDECIEGRDDLLHLIAGLAAPHVRVLVSSRHWTSIHDVLIRPRTDPPLELKLDQGKVTAAINHYIATKVEILATDKNLDNPTRQFLQACMKDKAQGTFLWVALAFQFLSKSSTRESIRTDVEAIPKGLQKFYENEILRISLDKDQPDTLKDILILAALVHKPITLLELSTVAVMPKEHQQRHDLYARDEESAKPYWTKMVEACQSFIIQDDKGTLRFIHDYAREVVNNQFINTNDNIGSIHRRIADRAISSLSAIIPLDTSDPKTAEESMIYAIKRDESRYKYYWVFWAEHASTAALEYAQEDLFHGNGDILKFMKNHRKNWITFLRMLLRKPEVRIIMTLVTLIETTQVVSEHAMQSTYPANPAIEMLKQTQNWARDNFSQIKEGYNSKMVENLESAGPREPVQPKQDHHGYPRLPMDEFSVTLRMGKRTFKHNP